MHLVEIMNNLKGKKKRVVVYVDNAIELYSSTTTTDFEKETGIEIAEGSICYDAWQHLAIYTSEGTWVSDVEV